MPFHSSLVKQFYSVFGLCVTILFCDLCNSYIHPQTQYKPLVDFIFSKCFRLLKVLTRDNRCVTSSNVGHSTSQNALFKLAFNVKYVVFTDV